MTSKRDQTWRKIFQGENIPAQLTQQGWAVLSTKTIKEKYQAEPRLLAKMDAAEYLPQVFRDHDAALLSLSNTEYAILHLGEGGKPLFPRFGTRQFWQMSPRLVSTQHLQAKIATIPWEKYFSSESQALDAALAAGLLQDFVGEQDLALTIRGRRRFQGSVPLQFQTSAGIQTFPLQASGFQIEVDGGYESPHHVYLIEAKNRIQQSFNLRQVFFPYLFWVRYLRQRRSPKTVRPIFLRYTMHHYLLSELEITDEKTLNAITIRRQAWYVLGDPPMTVKQLAALLQGKRPQPTLHAPFPQADRLLRLFSLLEEIEQAKNLSGEAIAEVQDFDRRQADYYGNAGRWLGWLKKEGQEFLLTAEGRRLVQASLAERVQQTFTVLCQRPVFHQSLAWWLQHRTIPDTAQIVPWLEEAVRRGQIRPLSQSTLKRRAQTVRGWLKVIVPWVQR